MTQTNILFIGMGVHKESIVLSLTDDDRSEVRRYGSIGGTLQNFKKTLRKRVETGKDLFFVMKLAQRIMNFIDISAFKVISVLSWLRHSFQKKPVIKLKQIREMRLKSCKRRCRARA